MKWREFCTFCIAQTAMIKCLHACLFTTVESLFLVALPMHVIALVLLDLQNEWKQTRRFSADSPDFLRSKNKQTNQHHSDICWLFQSNWLLFILALKHLTQEFVVSLTIHTHTVTSTSKRFSERLCTVDVIHRIWMILG